MWDWRELKYLGYFGWWPRYSTKSKRYTLSSYFGFGLFIWDFVQIGPEFIGLYQAAAKGSLKGTVINLNTTIMGVFCAFTIINNFVYQEDIIHIQNKLKELEKRAVSVLGEDTIKIMEYREKRCMLTMVILPFAFFTLTHWILRPLYLRLRYGEEAYIIESWTPWATSEMRGWLAVWILQSVHVFTAVSGLLLILGNIIAMFEMILEQFDFLRMALARLDFLQPGVDKRGPLSLRFCTEFHMDIMLVSARLSRVTGLLQMVLTLTIAMVNCLSVFEFFSMQNVTLIKMINLCELVICFTYILFVSCWQCHELTKQSSDVLWYATMNNWYLGSKSDQRSLMFLIERSRTPVKFGGIFRMNMETVVVVMKTTFSYYNFLKAVS